MQHMRKPKVIKCSFCDVVNGDPKCKWMVVRGPKVAICDRCIFTCIDVLGGSIAQMETIEPEKILSEVAAAGPLGYRLVKEPI